MNERQKEKERETRSLRMGTRMIDIKIASTMRHKNSCQSIKLEGGKQNKKKTAGFTK